MAKQKTVTVGCKLPNGLIIEVGGQSVELNGANASNIIGGHGITYDVDAPQAEHSQQFVNAFDLTLIQP